MLAMGTLQQAGTNAWLWYVIVGLILLALIVWFLFRRVKRMEMEALSDAPAERRAEPRRATGPDDLTKIEGIGPKVAKVLKEAGMSTFEALARADAAEVKSTLNAAGLQMMNPEGWIEQAELAAKGNWEGLQKLQDELQGGRRK